MRQAQQEEFNHFSMDLEFLLRRTPLWREIAEPRALPAGRDRRARGGRRGARSSTATTAADGSLGIGSLKEV